MSARSGSGTHPRTALGLERARLAVAMGKWMTARALLEDLLVERPDDFEAHSLHGLCLVRTGGDLEAAREACQRAIDAQPFAAHHRARLAEVYAALGLARRAETCTEDAQRLDPASTTVVGVAEGAAPRSRSWLRRLRRRASRPLSV